MNQNCIPDESGLRAEIERLKAKIRDFDDCTLVLLQNEHAALKQVSDLQDEMEVTEHVNNRVCVLIAQICVAVHGEPKKGDPLPSWHNLPELVNAIKAERDAALIALGRMQINSNQSTT